MSNVLSHDRKLAALRLLVEGNSLRSITRVTDIHRTALMRFMVTFGQAARQFLDEQMRGLHLRHVQVDEIWTFVLKKQGRLTIQERHNSNIGDQYLWVAFDQDTKLVPTFAIGKRSADMARRLMVDLARRLVLPSPNEIDDRNFKKGFFRKIVQISTDGFAAYPEAVDLAFGPYADYGTCIKDYRNADQPGRYAPPEMIQTQRRTVFGNLNPREFGTSHVERNNLTIRMFVKRFARLTLAFSKKRENLAAAVALHFAYFNFVWKPRTTNATPAMLAGVADREWTLEELYNAVLTKG
ncbi:MAG TPA: hypothetical protein VG055_16585 [Planctomycetaceae bacterium]|nr:hypothetical protein [Planctomycetaceae bacterium]